MLSQSLRRLEGVQDATVPEQPQQKLVTALLHALGPSKRDVHYVSHFQEPLDINVGDVGYIKGSPPRFTRLDNTYAAIGDASFIPNNAIQKFRLTPRNRWSTQEVDGIIRCARIPCAFVSFD